VDVGVGEGAVKPDNDLADVEVTDRKDDFSLPKEDATGFGADLATGLEEISTTIGSDTKTRR
jgi:hypothetical protein